MTSFQVPVIVCTNQILSEEEAAVMRANSWLYHYYMVQSRLQYGLAYGAHSPALPYYPHMLPAQPVAQFPGYSSEAGAGLGAGHHPYLAGAVHHQPHTSLYPGYLYPPSPHYTLPGPAHHTAAQSAHLSASSASDSKEGGQHSGPLDFSKDYSSSRAGEYSGGSQQSSPSLRSDTSSSPVYQPPHESLYGEVSLLTQAGRHSSIITDHHYKVGHNTRHRSDN